MFEKELEIALLACKEAMKNIMKYYNAGFHVEIKSDESPVTEADKTSDVLIKEIISKEFPNYSFLTEESDDDLSRLNNDLITVLLTKYKIEKQIVDKNWEIILLKK